MVRADGANYADVAAVRYFVATECAHTRASSVVLTQDVEEDAIDDRADAPLLDMIVAQNLYFEFCRYAHSINVAPFGCNQNEASDDVADRAESTGHTDNHRTNIALRRQSLRPFPTR